MGTARSFLPVRSGVDGKVPDGKGGIVSQFGVLTRPVLRGGDCKATL